MKNRMSDTEIALTQEKTAVVDEIDFIWLSQWKWHAHRRMGKWYSSRALGKKEAGHRNGKTTFVQMHNAILERSLDRVLGTEEFCDHVDGDGLNNQRDNLRPCSRAENMRNHKKYSNNTSGQTGVVWRRDLKKWQSRIDVDGNRFHLGYFEEFDNAVGARKDAEEKHFGEFAPAK